MSSKVTIPDSLRGRVLPPAHDDGDLIVAALAARVLKGQRHGWTCHGGRGPKGRVGRDLDGEVGRAVVAVNNASGRGWRGHKVAWNPVTNTAKRFCCIWVCHGPSQILKLQIFKLGPNFGCYFPLKKGQNPYFTAKLPYLK